jgi:DNA-binding PadR family transcriptional regulator
VSQKSRGIYLEPGLIDSQSFQKLSGTAKWVYLLFLQRRVMKKTGRKGKEKWFIENNGEIVFSYTEAQKKYGITKPRFQRALKELVEKGLIDVTHHGGGVRGDFSTYAICERWRDYGTEKFDFKTLPKDTRKLGFTKKNWEERTGKKRTKKEKSGNGNVNGSGNKNVTDQPQNILHQVTKTYP